MNTNSIIVACENAILNILSPYLEGSILEGKLLISDESLVKDPMPWAVIHATTTEEVITPNSGIYKVTVNFTFKSHVKETSTEQRTDAIERIMNFITVTPASLLSSVLNFHCHGFVESGGSMIVDGENKAYVYNTTLEVYCMPMDNV